MGQTAVHRSPAWLANANFIICADLTPHGMPGRFEQFWVRKIDDTTFEICCIPFFTYGIALGDFVKWDADSGNCDVSVTRKGGHKTLRIAVVDKEDRKKFHETLHEWVDSTGLLYEWHEAGYLAVDLPLEAQESTDLSKVQLWAEQGVVAYEIDE